MTSIPKYTYQDIVQFIQDGTPPEDLTCSVGFSLMRDPVRLNKDTADRPYDAAVARKILERNPTNPFTRAPVEAPALSRDPARQKDAQHFRAMLLGYTKVAAYLQETGQANLLGAPLLPPPASDGPTLRQIAVGQALRNGILRAMASRPLVQPQPPVGRQARHNYDHSINAYERAMAALRPAQQAIATAKRAAEAAGRVAERTSAVTRPPLWKLDAAWPEATQEVKDRGIDVGLFESTFGGKVLGLTGDMLNAPTAQTLRAVADKVSQRQQTLSDVLLFQDGAALHAILSDRAYEGLADVAWSLSERTTDTWRIGPTPGAQSFYLGQHLVAEAHGMGLTVKANQGGYKGGQWQHNQLHGDGRMASRSGSAAGRWHQGLLQQGVLKYKEQQLRGTFSGTGLDGYGIVEAPEQTSQGLWKQGQVVQGQSVLPKANITTTFGPSPLPDEQAVGRLTLGRTGTYYGALENGRAHGFGMLIKHDQGMFGGIWQHGVLAGPGGRARPGRTQYGMWPGRGASFVVAEEDLESSSDEETWSDDEA